MAQDPSSVGKRHGKVIAAGEWMEMVRCKHKRTHGLHNCSPIDVAACRAVLAKHWMILAHMVSW